MISYNYTVTRPDTSADFYHLSVEGAANMAALESVRESIAGLVYTNSISPDQLVYSATYEFDSELTAEEFNSAVNLDIPNFTIDRDTYFIEHGHAMEVVVG